MKRPLSLLPLSSPLSSLTLWPSSATSYSSSQSTEQNPHITVLVLILLLPRKASTHQSNVQLFSLNRLWSFHSLPLSQSIDDSHAIIPLGISLQVMHAFWPLLIIAAEQNSTPLPHKGTRTANASLVLIGCCFVACEEILSYNGMEVWFSSGCDIMGDELYVLSADFLYLAFHRNNEALHPENHIPVKGPVLLPHESGHYVLFPSESGPFSRILHLPWSAWWTPWILARHWHARNLPFAERFCIQKADFVCRKILFYMIHVEHFVKRSEELRWNLIHMNAKWYDFYLWV